MYYCVITDASFLSDLLNEGDIWQCNPVTAKWVVDHGYGYFSDAAGDPATPPWGNDPVPAPTAEGAVVADATPTVITVNFTGGIAISSTLGISVAIDAGSGTVSTAIATGDKLAITIGETIAAGEVVTVSYADGNIVSSGEGAAEVANFADLAVDNQVVA